MKAYKPFPELKYDRAELLKKFSMNSAVWKQYGRNPYDAIFTQKIDVPEITDQFFPGLLSDEIKFARVLKDACVSCHTDTRQVAVLVPVQVESGQFTTIYESSEESFTLDNLNIDGDENVRLFGDLPEVDRFFLDIPHFLNTRIPHGVINGSGVDRIILTFGFHSDVDNWDKIMELYERGELIKP